MTLIFDVVVYYTLDEASSYEKVRALARKAVAIDPDDPDTLATLAWTMLANGERDEGLHWASKALKVGSNSYLANCVLGMVKVFLGDGAGGRASLYEGFRINPRGPLNPIFMGIVIASHYFDRDYTSAIETATEVIATWPEYCVPHRLLVAALGQVGRLEEASERLRRALTLPGAVEMMKRGRLRHVSVEQYEHALEGLRKAGWEG
jgi:adenylate cyclase